MSVKDGMFEKIYIGTHIVYATEMTKFDYFRYRGASQPKEIDEQGFLVKLQGTKGTTSIWLPQKVFRAFYRPISNDEREVIASKEQFPEPVKDRFEFFERLVPGDVVQFLDSVDEYGKTTDYYNASFKEGDSAKVKDCNIIGHDIEFTDGRCLKVPDNMHKYCICLTQRDTEE